MKQIGLVEPKWLPTGQQTQNALKAVRFPTQDRSEKRGREGAEKGEDSPVIKDITMPGKADFGAGTTSPMNPNEA